MKNQKITKKELKQFIYVTDERMNKIIGTANQLLKRKKYSKSEIFAYLKNSKDPIKPIKELNDLMNWASETKNHEIIEKESESLIINNIPIEYPIYGMEEIEAGALNQMESAMRLPVTIAGALMPDAHEGYGLPIGGVLATIDNVVIPYAVGVDIACRMCMSVYDLPISEIQLNQKKLKSLLGEHTIFGVGSKNMNHIDTSVFEKKEWATTRIIRQNRDLAYSQLGTSGGGNHFVEWGELKVIKEDQLLGLKPNNYIALLSHSGSRGFGSEIATYYSKLAKSKLNLPREAANLAWLDLNSEEGQEYWIAMNLAGDYASANHHEIHTKISKGLGKIPLKVVENHHNFAWKEILPNGENAIIHRKGATPAGVRNIGIIPGSMTHPGFIVRGKGNPESLFSASHGAGRSMSRTKALLNYSKNDLEYLLEKAGVDLIGGDIDEIPYAYKDIEKVMAFQSELVEILAVFYPKIVRMAEPEMKRRRLLGDI